ncbi:mitochondrial 37S ribosomal protein rsm10 [Cytospora paraplurivora]|uniref:Small ribosomal subunit protein uS10m n=1 Tax=Cytospora paraplurivora TaxID=2898453 RepID=A0AAN9U238_9PEZI
MVIGTQLRYNSSTPPEKPSKPEQTTEGPAKAQTSENTTPKKAGEAQDLNADTHLEPPQREKAAQGEIKIHQAVDEGDVPGDVITNFKIPDVASIPRPRLDEEFLKSAFQQFRAVSADVQAGIEEVVARQIDAHDGVATSEVAEAVEALTDAKNVADFAAGIAAGTAEATVSKAQDAAVPKHDDAFERARMQEVQALAEELRGLDELREAFELEAAQAKVASEEAAAPESEAVKAAEEVRETEESDVGEAEVAQAEPYTATEAQEIVNEGVAKTGLETPAQKTEERLDSIASALEEELAKFKEDSLSSAVESELDQRTEESAAQLVETREEDDIPAEPSRLPRNVQALYLQPLRRQAQYGVPSCDLQLRSYSVRPLESFCDFALRAAYYLGLPAYGPTPLPKIIERWTVPKASFIFKKSQENFERITRRRLIQIRDGHPETVQIWLAFLQKHQQAGVGMKANVWEFSSLDVAKQMDEAYEQAKPLIDKKFKLLGQDKEFATVEKVDEILTTERYKLAGGR